MKETLSTKYNKENIEKVKKAALKKEEKIVSYKKPNFPVTASAIYKNHKILLQGKNCTFAYEQSMTGPLWLWK